MRKIRVLIVDDSALFREVLKRGIMADPLLEVAATAGDPFEARDKLIEFEPDVMTCDVAMPKMNGIEFLRRLLPQYAIPTIVITTTSDAVFEAMAAGAVDFVTKPDAKDPCGIENFLRELVAKLKTAAVAHVIKPAPEGMGTPLVRKRDEERIIALGASTGGTEALFNVVKALPPDCPGMVIVQHIPPVFSRMFADRLNSQTPFEVREAASGYKVEPGRVLIAPGDKHMRVKRLGREYHVECFPGDKVNGHCPSVDVLFESVARAAGSRAVGVILTGMGYDGAKGLLAMRRAGARTFGQDEASSVVFGMPRVAFNIGAVEKLLPLGAIPRNICAALNGTH